MTQRIVNVSTRSRSTPCATARRAAAAVFAACVAVGMGGGLTGCNVGGQSKVNANLPTYPVAVEQREVLDIHAIRDGTRVSLTNSTTTAFGPSRLWINRWFSREIDGLAIGQQLDLSLSDFKDQYGEEFRAGGFFATRKPDRLVLMQIENEGAMYGVVTAVSGDNN